MRRALLVALVVALSVVLAGCQVPGIGGQSTDPGTQSTDPGTKSTDTGSPAEDPEGDSLGWENGYWYDEELSVTTADGFNESELEATVARTMARVERVRGLEFEETVPVEVIDRSTYRNRTGGNHSEALRRFDNAKFEALFLVGEDSGSIEEQDENRGSTVAGYYSPGRDEIVIVAESETPTLSSERTLAHELVHALQDQHFDLGNASAVTRDAHQGRNGLVEGDASYTERRYMDRCGGAWSCLSTDDGAASGGGGSASINYGIYILQYFPYSEGPTFVSSLHDRGGWEAVDDAYGSIPDGATEVVEAARYPDWEPTNVSTGAVGDGWERISPPDRPNYGVLGQSAVAASLGAPLFDESEPRAIVDPQAFLNYRANGSLDRQRPFNYGVGPADGWAGGRFVAYQPADGDVGPDGNVLAYAWRTRWESASEAEEFTDAWTSLIEHRGGREVDDGTFVVDEGPYADAFRITVEDATVTVVNAPERDDLSAFADV